MERLSLRRDLLALSLALAGAAAVGSLALDADRGQRIVLPALEAREAAALCRASGLALPEFLERARAAGVGAVILRDRPLSFFQARGEILRFLPEEIEKWKAVGLVAAGFAPRPGALWIKDRRLLANVLESAARSQLLVSTSAAAGYHVVELSPPPAPDWSAAADPETAEAGKSALAVVRAAGEGGPSSAALFWRQGGKVEGSTDLRGGADMVLKARAVSVEDALAAWLNAAYGHPRRLLVIRLSPSAGVEENFDRLRRSLRELSRRGLKLGLPERAPEEPAVPSRWREGLRGLAGWLVGILGPLFAARAGLLALKRTRTVALIHWPVTSPVVQLAAGLVTAAAVAAGMGLAARIAFDSGQGLASAGWAFWTMAGPAVVGVLTLYTLDPEDWARSLAHPVTYRAALKLAAAVVGLLLLLAPREVLGLGALPAVLRPLGERLGPLWWLPWRWREVLVGFPCLLHAFFLVNWRMDCPDCEGMGKGRLADPRGWFLLGLLGPAGVVVALGRGGLPADVALSQTAAALAGGAALGTALIAARLTWIRSKDLKAHRTIVPAA